MSTARVSITNITMGKLVLRGPLAATLPSGAAPAAPPLLNHWTLRQPSGALIIDVHADEAKWSAHLTRSSAMFTDPVHALSCEVYRFARDEDERSALATFARAREATADGSPAYGSAAGDLKGRVVSFNYLPHLPDDVRKDVLHALSEHSFGSIAQLRLETPRGELLIDPYLDEGQLIDDFVFVRETLAASGLNVRNEWYGFTDRVHERALDHLAFGLGLLPALEP
jgi:hypothetical protein